MVSIVKTYIKYQLNRVKVMLSLNHFKSRSDLAVQRNISLPGQMML